MDNLKKIFDIKKPAFILIALPYILFYWSSIYHSPFFTYGNLGLLIATLLVIDLIVKWVVAINKKGGNLIPLVIVFISLLFFYGTIIPSFIQKLFNSHFNLFIRGRTIVIPCVILFIILIVTFRKRMISFKFLNIFLLIFSLVILVTHGEKPLPSEKTRILRNTIKNTVQANKSVKPVILIISDEYTSPDDLYKVNKDSAIYSFSKKLLKQGWLIKNSFYSYETSTIHSLSSLFNFNLSKNSGFSNQNITDIGIQLLCRAAIADSLKAKKVSIINYGIFDIGNSRPINRMYFYPKNFLENFLMFTSYYPLIYNTGGLKLSGMKESYFPMEIHNKYIFKTLSDTLQTISNPKKFVYVHLYMPHTPMVFTPEFPLRKKYNLTNYQDYWSFTNQKLEKLLKELIKSDKYKIILTGDHGFRDDKRIRPHYTFTAFYGFDQVAIDQIKSVQDLGSLINSSF